ncbi:CopG-like DNA-binding protein [Planktothrix serta PCC 8927]|uniref:CopG-like DNA-binding protein n=1 Tax=Planktothrix serta PCC 8927 TaxID=671068 RepID=A0A7Z9DWM6_9CYAN|nr:hypothetical protein [Planktothrix serta]VXD15377.1 CopG-like DNA-binding protein [Planktothrix serta PCC 8927]
MNKKQTRKPLSDALAQEFVYGENSTPQVSSKPETTPEPTPQQQRTFMDKLQVQPKEGTKRFTVDLAEPSHRKLSIWAARTGRTKAEIVRLLLDEALKDVSE